ncbi:MAG TPA: glycosyltransferase [Bacteroidales bacterium]|nr:glycosyltransferase [Bacteroidales bacterium]
MKVIHVSNAKSWRGGEQQLAYLLGAFLSDTEIQSHVLCRRKGAIAKYCEQKGIAYSTFDGRGSFNLSAALKLLRICNKSGKCLIHTHDSHAHSIAFIAATLFGNLSPVIVHRRVDFRAGAGFISRKKYNHRCIARYICVSNAIRDILLPSLSHPEKAIVIPSGIDPERFAQTKNSSELRSKFGISPCAPLIGNIAALAPHKDHFTFLRTASILHQRNPEMRFVIVGHGAMRKQLLKAIEEMMLQNILFLAGFKENIPAIIKEFDLFLMTSKTEGLGTTLLDAFAAGIPVVSTNAGGIGEIVEHGHTGLLAPVGNAESLARLVEEVMNNPDLKDRIIHQAKLRADENHFRITAGKIKNEYLLVAKQAFCTDQTAAYGKE